MGDFRKKKDCPSSEAVLAFVGRMDAIRVGGVARHLAVCEFCRAEAELYRRHPPVEEKVITEEIPRPLLQLAEALLQKKEDLSPLYRLIDHR